MKMDSLLLAAWKHVSQHWEIEQSMQEIARLLFRQAGCRSLRLDRIYTAPDRIETVGHEFESGSTGSALNFDLSKAELERLEKLLQGPGLIGGLSATDLEPFAKYVPNCNDVASWICPLASSNGLIGLFVATADQATERTSIERILLDLREPLVTALQNDTKYHELRGRREAADADRRILLEKLGRHQVQDEIVGANRGLKSVMERVELVADSDMPVLILGETGTGKEVISRAIHLRSRRADGPFIRVNCGAIPSELIDSQLFGHEKGSFTGATDQHQGWFERACGGTLFLDEIGELPLAAQVRLLRVLQDHQIERIGGRKPIHVDVRIVAATHRDLSQMVRERTFREDLWYRVNVFPIFLPRLRDRVEDLPVLTHHFVRRAAERFGLPFVPPTPIDLMALTSYPWPGNVRELGAVIDRAVILGRGQTLEVTAALGISKQTHLPIDSGPTYYEVIPESAPSQLSSPASIVDLDEATRQHICRALTACRGQVEGKRGAATLLGINPHTLRARMRKLGIDWDSYRTK